MLSDRAQRLRIDVGVAAFIAEHRDQRVGDRPHQHSTRKHDYRRDDYSALERRVHSLLVARAVVVADDRHNALIQPEARHENKALKLEVDAEDIDRHG